jgi:rare lipoprotein A
MSLLLSNCAGGDRIRNSAYSPKVVADGDPVPRGGGSYKVGRPYSVNGRTYFPEENVSYRAEGIASWYGRDFHGRRTANGEVYDMHAISAAHPTLPMPSYARVTNLENGRSIIVRINDRGPYARNRIIDLSTGAAKALHVYGRGLARVRVEYAGRASLAGSDDTALLASLRETPPGLVPSNTPAATRMATPMPPERPFTLGERNAPARERSAPVRAAPRVAKAPVSAAPAYSTAEREAAPAEGLGSLGLMSGRGLY